MGGKSRKVSSEQKCRSLQSTYRRCERRKAQKVVDEQGKVFFPSKSFPPDAEDEAERVVKEEEIFSCYPLITRGRRKSSAKEEEEPMLNVCK